MVMETLGADFLPGQAKDMTKEMQGSDVSIKFGIVDNKQVMNDTAKEEMDNNTNVNFPKDAVDEWPAPKQIHSFYLVKYRSYEDPKLKVKFEQAEKEVQKRSQARFQIIEALKEKRSERSSVISQLKPLVAEDREYRAMIGERRKEMEPFQAALGKLRTAENARRSEGICSSEKELDDLIRSLHFRLQHESNTIAEEKQLLKDIKHLEGTREKVISNASVKAKIGDSFGLREDMLGQVKQIGVHLDVVKKDQLAVRVQIKKLEDQLKAIDDEIGSLQEELNDVDNKRGKAFDTVNELRKAREESNACFYQNRSHLNNVKTLAAKKDIASLEELCNTEVEKFMSQWNSNKSFRDDYERRVLPSLDGRQMSRDGRMRNPDEKLIIQPEVVISSIPEPPQSKANTKRPKDDVTPPPQQEKVSVPKIHKEETNKSNEAEVKTEVGSLESIEASLESEKSKKDSLVANEIDATKLKEMKREEEIAKAKMALERKKKLAEKAEAKAAARALKEAEKKLKEKEKKARKKAGVSAVQPVEDVETETETVAEEPEMTEASKESTLSSKSNKEQKENNVRSRNRQRVVVQPPKPNFKRKKSPSYLAWAIPAAAISLLIVMLLGYYYYGKALKI